MFERVYVARALALLSTGCCACSYPEFDFAGRDAALVEDTGRVADSATEDTGAATDSAGASDTTPVDAAADSPMDSRADVVDTAVPTGCAAAASLFCDDFDGVALEEKWGAGSTGSGVLAVSTSAPFSPPKALRSMLGVGASGYAKVGRTFTAPTAAALTRIDVRLFVENATFPGGKAVVIKTQQGGGHGVGLLATSTGFGIEVYGLAGYDIYPLPAGAIPVGKWFRFRIDTTLRTAGGMYKIFVDNMTTPIAERSALSTTDADGTSREYTVGLYTESPTTAAYAVRFDDVRFDFPP